MAAASEKPPLPWRARLLVGAVSVLHSASLRRDGTVNRFLLSLFDRVVPPNPAPDAAGVSSSDHAVSDNLRVRLFVPAADRDGGGDHLPVVVYFHGGGFVFHSVASAQFDALCRRFAALRWVLAGAGGALPSPPATVFVAGDSAGGNVAHHVVARTPSSVSGLIALQPFFAGETPTASENRLRDAPFGSPERISWLWRAFLPPGATRDHDAANVPAAFRRDAEPQSRRRAFPPTMVCVGGWDAHQDRQRDYADALRAAGAEEVVVAEFPDAIHAFYIFDDLADSKRLLTEVAAFINRRRAAAAANSAS